MARMIARNPTKLEVERAAEIAAAAFPNLTLEHWQESFHTVADMFGEQFIFVVEMDGQLVSSMLCCPAPVYIGGAPIPHASAGAVGTLPNYRKNGCAEAMMTQCVKVLREEGICTSSLWPFSYEYYRKFGWELAAEARSWSADASVFAALGNASLARQATADDLDDIKDCYAEFAQTLNCATHRSDDWWTRIARIGDYLKPDSSSAGTVAHVTAREVDGYAAYAAAEKDDRKSVEVKEIVYFDSDHRRDMLAFIAGQFPESRITFWSPVEDIFHYEVPNPRAVQVSVQPSFQFRVVDPEAAIISLEPVEEVEGKLTLSLDDPVFKQGFEFGIEVSDGVVEKSRPNSRSRIRMDVQTLAQLLSGALTFLDALEMGKAKAPEHALEAVALAVTLFPALPAYRSWLEPG